MECHRALVITAVMFGVRTDAAQGDVAWGATLLPRNLGLQILLLPLYLWLLVGHVLYLNPWTLLQSVGIFFVAPFAVGWGLQW